MRAAVFIGNGQIRIEEMADPEPAVDGLVVRVERCGVCGTDVALTTPGVPGFAPGTRLGHECAGEVVAIGREVQGMRVGDRVACMPWTGCGNCPPCRDGRMILCHAHLPHGGGFADFITPTARGVFVLPRSLSFTDGALVEPMACGLHALRQAGFRGGERVLVLGAGAIALSVIFWARRLGAARIVAASRSAHRVDVLQEFGADAVVSLGDPDPLALVAALGGPPDVVAECVGKPGMLEGAIAKAAIGGKVISLGMCGRPDAVVPAACAMKEVQLHFAVGYSPVEFAETARAFDAGNVRIEAMAGEVIGLDALSDTIDALRGGRKALKVMVDPALR